MIHWCGSEEIMITNEVGSPKKVDNKRKWEALRNV